ncbi:indole-3-glycerol phosphate synthase TrpC [Paenisporosarcina indica]|uniref:indole-3-glycerol phosphate synthase TrpC n=1 Tax=Paenisporosarcina indica TaxID=650093 RepID=UPI00094FE95C|nr:indole-3-glycerol phosphate synthase TrpC [Paenisporosarcina indica]
MTILSEILQVKKREVADLLSQPTPYTSTLTAIDKPSLFERLTNAKHLHVIAEIKRASPSKGVIEGNINPIHQALAYEQAGAAAISVLTDQQFFNGTMQDLQAVSAIVNLPVLCKDFMIHQAQIDRAKEYGASIILLIVAAMDQETLQQLFDYATCLDLEVLVEVHDVDELQRALSIGAQLIGVNNRNLKTFTVDLTKTEEIAAHFPFHEKRVLISESGIVSTSDASFVAQFGASAILVGETLMRSEHVEETLSSLHVKRGEMR